MQFHVPQFLEVEDRMFGFLTLKQFLYIAGGCGLAYVAYTYLYWFLAYPLIFASIGLGFALAFAKVNSQPFIAIIDAFLHYIAAPKLYVWKKISKPIAKKGEDKTIQTGIYVPPLSSTRLKDIAWSLDIQSNNPGNEQINSGQEHRQAPLLKDI